MYIEYYINTIDDKELDIKSIIDNVIKYPISAITAPHQQIKFIKKNYGHLYLGSFIDYPMASCDSDRRQDLILDAVKLGINYVNITIPFYHIINRKYTKFREDISKNLEICKKHQIDLRYILEYRKFDHTILAKVCEILMEGGISIVYPSTGLFLDNIEDNIIACAYLQEKTGINTIVNGNIWKHDQIDPLMKIKPFGLSSNQISTLSLIQNDLYDKK